MQFSTVSVSTLGASQQFYRNVIVQCRQFISVVFPNILGTLFFKNLIEQLPVVAPNKITIKGNRKTSMDALPVPLYCIHCTKNEVY